MTFDDKHLIKLMNLGLPLSRVASKMGMTEVEVAKRWSAILAEASQCQQSGYFSLCEAFKTLAVQYQLVGESLKVIGTALDNTMPMEEVALLVVPDREQTLLNLKNKCIILRPFIPPPPADPKNS